jgi:hypothetical protein
MNEKWITPATPPATDEDRAAIEAAVRDYFEGWFEADPGRMARALHPALAKRSFGQGADRAPDLGTTTADEMVASTARGYGRDRVGDGRLDIRIDDVSGGIASVTVQSAHYVEYVHLAATPDGWRVVNTLWRWADGHGPRA